MAYAVMRLRSGIVGPNLQREYTMKRVGRLEKIGDTRYINSLPLFTRAKAELLEDVNWGGVPDDATHVALNTFKGSAGNVVTRVPEHYLVKEDKIG